MRRALLVAGLLLGACGAVPPPASCPGPDGSRIETIGVDASCAGLAQALERYRDAEIAAWGPIPLAGWTVQFVSLDNAPVAGGEARYGLTNWNAKRVTVVVDRLEVVAHELHHVALGPTSYAHVGWCPFGSWELQALGFDERVYLGCP